MDGAPQSCIRSANMFLGSPPATHDRILDFSTAVTGTLFFVPTVDFLDELPDPPGAGAVVEPGRTRSRRRAQSTGRAVRPGRGTAGLPEWKPPGAWPRRASSSNPPLTLPAEVRDYPTAISQAVSALRLAGVGGPYTLVLSADAYTLVSETAEHGYPIRQHVAWVVDGEIIWAPAIDGAFLLSTRGGDFELRLGQDLSIGYLAHDATSIQLCLQETLTFLVYTSEASVAFTAAPGHPVY